MNKPMMKKIQKTVKCTWGVHIVFVTLEALRSSE